jgi:NADPH:quinone reductase-like Zn-dependent oxidoreductase
MKAMTQDHYGSSSVLRLDEVATPAPGADEVLVRVRAAGVGPEVWHLMTGRPYLVRLMGFGVRAPKQRVPGRDLAGTVEAVGSATTAFQPGDEVFGSGRGTLAEYACASGRGCGKGRRRRSARAQAGQPHVRAGGGGRDLGDDRASEPSRRGWGPRLDSPC